MARDWILGKFLNKGKPNKDFNINKAHEFVERKENKIKQNSRK